MVEVDRWKSISSKRRHRRGLQIFRHLLSWSVIFAIASEKVAEGANSSFCKKNSTESELTTGHDHPALLSLSLFLLTYYFRSLYAVQHLSATNCQDISPRGWLLRIWICREGIRIRGICASDEWNIRSWFRDSSTIDLHACAFLSSHRHSRKYDANTVIEATSRTKVYWKIRSKTEERA